MKMELKFDSFMCSHVNPKTQFKKLISLCLSVQGLRCGFNVKILT